MAEVGRYEFYIPKFIEDGKAFGVETFSVGIFRWVEAKSGGVKKGPALVRVKGSISFPSEVRAEAQRITDMLNAGADPDSFPRVVDLFREQLRRPQKP